METPPEERLLDRTDWTAPTQGTGSLASGPPQVQPTGFFGQPVPVRLPAPPEPPQRRTFDEGETVAGRYRIVRFLAEGGMGEVYEAQDLELREAVALKTIRPKAAAEGPALERFRREVLLARRVTHRNVCRLLEFGQHALADGSRVLFLTMELLRGQTLAARLRSGGRMIEQEALLLARQICSALAAAHEAGVVHRDFKSANVMLVPARDGSVRAVVTDFGLAFSSELDGGASLTGGGIVGTPAYMAPEQVEGGRPAGPAADIYALGVVLYEMVTGCLPFAGDSPLAVAVQRLKQRPLSPRMHASSLDTRWESAILRCLEREPEQRFTAAAEVLRALEGAEPSAGRTRGRRRKALLAVAATLAASLLAVSLLWHPASEPVPAAAYRRSVAVLGFANLSGQPETQWVSTALSEMLGTELAGHGKLQVVPGENVARARLELALGGTGTSGAGPLEVHSYGKETLRQLRHVLGADLVVLGSYLDLAQKSGGQIVLDLKLQDAAEGETLAAFRQTGSELRLADLVAEAGARLRRELGLEPIGAEDRTQVRSSLPANLEAARLYAEGLDKLRSFDALAARALLESAVAADPRNPLIRSAMAQAWSELGYDVQAAEEAKRALDLSEKLSREERLLVEGRHAELSKDQGRAIQIYEALFTLFPDSLEHGLRLAAAQTAASRGQEALSTLEVLHRLPAPASTDVRIDLAEAWARTYTEAGGGLLQAQAVAARAVAAARARGAHLLAARALLWQAAAQEDRGSAAAMATYEEARSVFEAAGNRAGVAQAMLGIANMLRYQGELARARSINEEALEVYRQIGHRAGMALALRRIGAVLGEQGQFDQARPRSEEALALYREVRDRPGEAAVLNNLGTTLRRLGELEGARSRFEEALALAREIRLTGAVAFTTMNLGRLLFDQGRLAEALSHYQEALAYWDSQADLNSSAEALSAAGQVLLAQGDLVGARRYYEAALERKTQAGDKQGAAESQMKQAALAIEEGRFADAEVLARRAAEEFALQTNQDFEAAATAHLARALLGGQKPDEAREQALRALALTEGQKGTRIRLMVEIAVAPVLAASGRADDLAASLRSLETALAEATGVGYVGLQLDARLALGQLEMRAGHRSEGRARLEALKAEAQSLGFALIVRKAAEALR